MVLYYKSIFFLVREIRVCRTTFLEPLFYSFLEKWLQNKWSNALNMMKRSVSLLKYEFFCYIIERGILTFEIFPHLKNLLTIVIWNICLDTFMRLKEGHCTLFFVTVTVIVTVIMILAMFIFYYCLK